MTKNAAVKFGFRPSDSRVSATLGPFGPSRSRVLCLWALRTTLPRALASALKYDVYLHQSSQKQLELHDFQLNMKCTAQYHYSLLCISSSRELTLGEQARCFY